jgi:hypothetical protein
MGFPSTYRCDFLFTIGSYGMMSCRGVALAQEAPTRAPPSSPWLAGFTNIVNEAEPSVSLTVDKRRRSTPTQSGSIDGEGVAMIQTTLG